MIRILTRYNEEGKKIRGFPSIEGSPRDSQIFDGNALPFKLVEGDCG